MKRKSIVWQFFDRIIEDKVTKSVVCRLCDSEYKFLGNTTNLKAHLTRKHPIQWELVVSQTDEFGNSRQSDDEQNKKAKYEFVYDVDCERDENAEEVEDADSERRNEEWLEEDPFELKPQKTPRRKIKSERSTPQVLQFEEVPQRLLLEGTTSASPRDQFDAFGEYVARRLRTLKSSGARANVQQLMSTMLWQAEFGAFDKQDSVRKVLLTMVVDKPMVSYTAQMVLDDRPPESDQPQTQVRETKQT